MLADGIDARRKLSTIAQLEADTADYKELFRSIMKDETVSSQDALLESRLIATCVDNLVEMTDLVEQTDVLAQSESQSSLSKIEFLPMGTLFEEAARQFEEHQQHQRHIGE